MSEQDKGKQSILNPQTKTFYNPKQKENREEFASSPKERNKTILLVPNPADPLKSSSGEKAVQKAGFELLRLLDLEAGNHGLKNLQSLDFTKPETGYLQIDIL